MKDDLFRELEASVREGGAILRGEKSPSRTLVIENPDVKGPRDSLPLSQPDRGEAPRGGPGRDSP